MAIIDWHASSVPTSTASFDRAGGHVTVYVSGDLDAASSPAIEAETLRHVQPGDERLWMDMSAVTFCDSSGLMVLLRLHRHAERTAGRFIVYNPSHQVRRVIDICGLNTVLAIRQ
jgi:anti-anti-sigma factor